MSHSKPSEEAGGPGHDLCHALLMGDPEDVSGRTYRNGTYGWILHGEEGIVGFPSTLDTFEPCAEVLSQCL